MLLQPTNEQNHKRQNSFRQVFFSTVKNRFPPESVKSQNLFFSRKIAISQISVVVRHSRNDKSQIRSLENLQRIVRQAKIQKSANSVVTDSSCYVAKADSSSKIFHSVSLSVFIFYYAA